MTDNLTTFTHTVTSTGPAIGMTFTGRRNLPVRADGDDVPLVVALHGGGYTSAYFDVPGYSLLTRAERIDVPVVAIDRPGYGESSPVAFNGSPFLANAAVLDHLICELWETEGAGRVGVVLIGHSMGASISMAIAARHPKWPLLGVALSGCLLRVPEVFAGEWTTPKNIVLETPHDQKAALMFGPKWTRRSDMPDAQYFANVPVYAKELAEASSAWLTLFRDLAPKVTVPVHLRQGEFEQLWVTDGREQLTEFVAGLTSSPWVDADVFPAAGHTIDYHRGGAAFQLQQLSFALTCATRQLVESVL